MFCKTRTVFLGRLPARAEVRSTSIRGSLLPERLRLSAAGGNDRQIAKQIVESPCTRSPSGIEPKKTMGKLT